MVDLIQLVREELQRIIDNIDAGNSKMSEEDAAGLVTALQQYTHKDEWLTKYQACQFLGRISRATFDNLVANEYIPRGTKKYQGDSSLFWRVTDLLEYRKMRDKKVPNQMPAFAEERRGF